MTENKPIPGSIVKAICAIQATLTAVKKSQKNTHGGYNFASTDDIYAALTQKMGEVGLVILALEETATVERHENKEGKTSPWLKAVYKFVLATEDATWVDVENRRTMLIQITGPQTFQGAQSYCEKSYLRSLFKIPTGDMDLDSLPEGYEYNPVVFKPKAVPPAPPAPPSTTIKAPESDAKPFNVSAFMDHLERDLSTAQDDEALGENWAHHEATMEDNLSRPQREAAMDIYQKHETRIAAVEGGR